MHEKNSQFILLKIPPHLIRLLGKINALIIEVLRKIAVCFLWLSLPGHYRVTDEALLAETT